MIAATKHRIFEMTFSTGGSGSVGNANPSAAQTANTTTNLHPGPALGQGGQRMSQTTSNQPGFAERTLADIAATPPGATGVFRRRRLDFCYGGTMTSDAGALLLGRD
jgi:hypothetical protein